MGDFSNYVSRCVWVCVGVCGWVIVTDSHHLRELNDADKNYAKGLCAAFGAYNSISNAI